MLLLDTGKYSTENEGNLFRFFALLHVGRDAMKLKLDQMRGNPNLFIMNLEMQSVQNR